MRRIKKRSRSRSRKRSRSRRIRKRKRRFNLGFQVKSLLHHLRQEMFL